MRDRERLEKHLEAALAPYAARASASRGRRVDEDEPPYRGKYQRDRDRIVHCGSFRRLEYKTQVFVSVLGGDMYRNRLTHTMEVTQIARTIARGLGLNEDLVETLALAHDLGHSPFGHSGEHALNDLMRDHGGFNHNLQGLRIVDQLERRYPDFTGLNLTYETREGYAKNLSPAARGDAGFAVNEKPTLEAQLVEHADEIAYDTHDVEDSLASGIIVEDELRSLSLWRDVETQVRAEYAEYATDTKLRWRAVVRRLIRTFVDDLMAEVERRVAAHKIETLAAVRGCGADLVGFSPAIQAQKEHLEDFLHRNFYRNPRVRQHTARWQRRLQQLFATFIDDPSRLPADHLDRVDAEGEVLERVVCDYVAGMTDRFAERTWGRYCGHLDPGT